MERVCRGGVKIKILMAGASPFIGSGYGRVVRHLAPYLAKRGHQVYLLATAYRGEELNWAGVTILSTHEGATYSSVGNELVRTELALREHKPDAFLVIGDILLLEPVFEMKMKGALWKLVAYFPIDSDFWRPREIKYAKYIDVPVVPSRFGVNVLRKQGGIEGVYIPHGVDTESFRPYPPSLRNERRKMEGVSDAFLVTYVGTNNFRKNIPCLLEAFSIVKKRVPEAKLCLITAPRDASGYDLVSLARVFNLTDSLLTPPSAVAFSLSTTDLVSTYNIADVYTSATVGEGFSLTHLEALACGCPVVSPRHSALTELLEGVGILTDTLDWGYIDSFGSWKPAVSPESLADGILQVYNMSEAERAKMGRASRTRALDYEWSKVLREWDKIFEGI